MINGETHILAHALTLSGLLQAFQVDTEKAAIEYNQNIIPRAEHMHTSIQEGDCIEIVEFIGGG